MARQLGLSLSDLDRAWIPTVQGQRGHGKLWIHWGSWSLESLKADSPSSLKGVGLNLMGQNTALSIWPGIFLTVPDSDGELLKSTDSHGEWRGAGRLSWSLLLLCVPLVQQPAEGD